MREILKEQLQRVRQNSEDTDASVEAAMKRACRAEE